MLVVRKWPAYRFLPPLEATRLFHASYVEAYKNYYRTNIDFEAAPQLKIGLKLNLLKSNAHLTQLVGARQRADRIGLPYPAYLEFAFEFVSRRKYKHPPQPNQLWPTEEKKLDAWIAKLDEFWSDDRHTLELNRMDPLPQYVVDYDLGLPAQRQFREELVQHELHSNRPLKSFVGKHVVELRHLDANDCAAFGTDTFSRAERLASQDLEDGFLTRHNYTEPSPESFYQSCFGVPGIDTSDEYTCGRCPHFSKCAAARLEVVTRVIAETGSREPIEEARKKKNRERVARHRAHKKGETTEL